MLLPVKVHKLSARNLSKSRDTTKPHATYGWVGGVSSVWTWFKWTATFWGIIFRKNLTVEDEGQLPAAISAEWDNIRTCQKCWGKVWEPAYNRGQKWNVPTMAGISGQTETRVEYLPCADTINWLNPVSNPNVVLWQINDRRIRESKWLASGQTYTTCVEARFINRGTSLFHFTKTLGAHWPCWPHSPMTGWLQGIFWKVSDEQSALCM